MIIISDCTEKSYLMIFLKNLVIGMNFCFGKKNANGKFKTAEKKSVCSFDSESALKKILPAYAKYYDIKTEGITEGFNAEAEFHFYNNQYFLVKSIKLSDFNSHDYVFFVCAQEFSFEKIQSLSQKAWKTALQKIEPVYGHKNSDITLVVLSNSLKKEDGKKLKKIRFTKSFNMGMYGWSNFKLVALSLEDEKFYSNWHGRDLKKQLKKILLN